MSTTPFVTVVDFPGAIDNLLREPGGDLGGKLEKLGGRIRDQAKDNATHRPGPERRTGNLYDSIDYTVDRDGDSLVLSLVVGMYYGRFLELGWTSSAGNYFQYPFLAPAVEQVLGGGGITAV